MKSPLVRLRGLVHHHHRERKAHHQRPPSMLDELADAAQDVEEMRNCYDGLLSAAASTTNSVYEFAEALEEMGGCILAKTVPNYDDDDDDSVRVLTMLGRAQFELQKYVDRYRTNIIDTITTPSESLLKELQTLEEMKHQCDMKREAYEGMMASHGEKVQSKNSKIESRSTEQLQASLLKYQADASMFIFRLKSLKQGQFHSLLTQVSRHHAAQLNFFRKGIKCLEVLEPHVKAIAEKHHIDYQFNNLEDDELDTDGYGSIQDTCSDDGELSFNYEINDRDQDFLTSRCSMDLDERDMLTFLRPPKEMKQEEVKLPKAEVVAAQMKSDVSLHLAPISADHLVNHAVRLKQMSPSSAKLSYKLPTPVNDNNPRSTVVDRSHHSAQFFESKPSAIVNLWHSSPLMKDKVNTMHSVKLPSSSEFKKAKKEYWSGPIINKAESSKPISPTDHITSIPVKPHGHPQQSLTASPKISALATVSIKISELHELPRPPANMEPLRPSGMVGYSGPLVSKRRTPMAPSLASPTAWRTASSLPRPPAALARSYSIPSNS